jgi:hypothetical protein
MATTQPSDPAWEALVTVTRLEELLPMSLYPGSKDWMSSDVVGRVEWLLAMYENVKADRDRLVDQLADISSGEPD